MSRATTVEPQRLAHQDDDPVDAVGGEDRVGVGALAEDDEDHERGEALDPERRHERDRRPERRARHGSAGGGALRLARRGAHRSTVATEAQRPARCARGVLACEGGDEARVVARVAPPQAARLAREAVGPLEAHALHPGRRLRDDARRGSRRRRRRRRGSARRGGRASRPSTSPAWAGRCRPRRRPRPSALMRAATSSLLGVGQRPERRRPAADDPQARGSGARSACVSCASASSERPP